MWLWDWIGAEDNLHAPAPGPQLFSGEGSVALRSLARQSLMPTALPQLAGHAVMLASADALTAALAIIELDGLARRVMLCPPDVRAEHLPALAVAGDIDTLVGSDDPALATRLGLRGIALPAATRAGEPLLQPLPEPRRQHCDTEWLLLTSGTSGPPKLVEHSMAGLTHAFACEASDPGRLWSSFYDIRRYGGLQILLRSLRCRGMLLFDASESLPGFLAHAGKLGVTHISGTASHWRAVLMSGAAETLRP
ncbi:MAG TPA: hypothetical protein VKT19_04315, partial [Steroidobacteraceae bacterium]|nr:hypothetical protein [Steroidobacteraceae bacterium]